MNIEPLLTASPIIQFHVVTVVSAAILGAYVLLSRKGTPVHRLLGKIWMALMVLTSISTFFIHTIRTWGPFSPIHILSVVVIVSAFLAIRAARRHNIKAHKSIVTSMYLGGVGIAGLFTVMPGRLMNKVLLSGAGGGGFSLLVIVAGTVAILFLLVARVKGYRGGMRRSGANRISPRRSA